MTIAIDIDRERIAEFCRDNHIKRLALFGSVLRDDFSPDSDVDVLVEFEDGHLPGLGFFTLQRELGEMLGKEVDLRRPQALSEHFKDEVLREAVTIYEQEE